MPERRGYSASLARSLVDRAGNLGQYVRSIQSANSSAEGPYQIALDLFYAYTELVLRQAELDLRVYGGPRQSDILEMRLRDLFQKEELFDQRFARGSQSQVPRALNTIARRELRLLGLTNYEAVLTVGPPGSFETHRTDLESFLFRDFRGIPIPVPAGGRPRIAVVSVPYVEGSRSLWFPICLGHELGHVRIEHYRGTPQSLPDFSDSIDELDGELAALLDAHQGLTNPGLGQVQDLRSQLRQWTEELACDLNAVRVFGPAGMTSITEFLASLRLPIGDTRRWVPQQASGSHPSLNTRVKLMARFLERLGFRNDSGYIQDAKAHAAATEGDVTPIAGYLNKMVDERGSELIEHVLSWGEAAYKPSHYALTVALSRTLSSGIPGQTHFTTSNGAQAVRATIADVVNASWMARDHQHTTFDQGPQARNETSRQTSHSMADYSARVALDNLTNKAIDDLEFCALWRMAGRHVMPPVPTIESPEDTGAGVLSGAEIIVRMGSIDRSRRVVITPLLDGAIQDAGVDLRLGADFIVFRHSSTSVFDPIGLEQDETYSNDPRKVQESVTKAWGEPFILHPSELVLAATLEYIALPGDLTGQVVTRSSYGRLGLITATAVQVQPGSSNCITLELVNLGPTPISLMPGARIGQLVLSSVLNSQSPSPGKYRGPTGPEFSKVRDDRDAPALRQVSRLARYAVGRNGQGRRVPLLLNLQLSGRGDFSYLVLRVLEVNGFRASISTQDRESETFDVECVATVSEFVRIASEFSAATGLFIRATTGALAISEDSAVLAGECVISANEDRQVRFVFEHDAEAIARYVTQATEIPDGRWRE